MLLCLKLCVLFYLAQYILFPCTYMGIENIFHYTVGGEKDLPGPFMWHFKVGSFTALQLLISSAHLSVFE